MFGFKKNKNPEKNYSEDSTVESTSDSAHNDLADKLSKTRRGFADGIADFLLGKKSIDSNFIENIETCLLQADVGIDVSTDIINELHNQLSRNALNNVNSLKMVLQELMVNILLPSEEPLDVSTASGPYVILVVGINGAGKTTTIGKLAKKLQNEGKSVLLAAGDTFRAAAIEQLQEWASRNSVNVVAQSMGTDPAAVIYDAVESAKAKNIDVVIADTAGRLHTQSDLMGELEKINRVVKKLDKTAPHETLLVLDAGFGQNALQQAEQFHKSINLTGLVITKLDGTAKGGIIFAIAKKLALPIRFIGVGEQISDLKTFNANQFVNALLE